MTGFSLHAQLAADTEWVETLSLCRVLLMNDSTYPWLILVPERAGIREIHELSEADQQTLMREMTAVARIMELAFDANKMNVAALGNMVPQLHIHVIARYEGDPAWPGPIWGKTPAVPYEADVKRARIEHLREHLRTVPR
ncbi:HIT domain-containing protein [Kordiimonas gwangyangensis]|uniref:HIT domain-containing protein n=1 Tax=Kordiimonas gwangyangensis TaxID=288022 RepID=UPI00036317D2|nr:HIT family protein [Kordiimonas gwangyangensis]